MERHLKATIVNKRKENKNMGIVEKIKLWWKTSTPTEKIGVFFKGMTAAAAIGGAVYCEREMRKSRELVKFAVNKIGDNVDVEVSDELINMAIEKSAKDQIGRAVHTAAEKTRRYMDECTSTQVEKAVKECYGGITDEIGKRLALECEKINKQDLLEEIKEKAKEQLSEKFDEKLDAIADEYTKNLNNMGKVYEALAEKMNAKAI